MSITLKTTTKIEEVADFIVASILSQLNQGKRVLFFVTGGSSIAVGVKVSELLKGNSVQNLTIMLTDERYGEINHSNSNFFQLSEKGFNLSQAKIIPILINENINVTTQKFNENLTKELNLANYKIGLFGVGADGHTAGILPESVAVDCQDFASNYNTPLFSRITITPKTIEKFNEAVVFMQGEEKWPVIKDLLNEDINILKQPAQVLKKVPLLTIFSDLKS